MKTRNIVLPLLVLGSCILPHSAHAITSHIGYFTPTGSTGRDYAGNLTAICAGSWTDYGTDVYAVKITAQMNDSITATTDDTEGATTTYGESRATTSLDANSTFEDYGYQYAMLPADADWTQYDSAAGNGTAY